MTAPGFCTCKRDFPERRSFHPPINATWHFLCDKPVLPALGGLVTAFDAERARIESRHAARVPGPAITPTGTGWPEDGEAQRIAEVFEDARAELDRGWDARDGL